MLSEASTHLQPHPMNRWELTEFGENAYRRTFGLPNREVIVGRTEESDLVIAAMGVSKRHARISFSNGVMLVEDLGSTNGTFLNGKQIECSTVIAGDLIQFANALYRVGRREESVAESTMEEGVEPWAETLILFDRLMSECAVVPNFQTIVSLPDCSVVAHELLARSEVENLSNPAMMFGAAERLGQQCALSELLRREGVRRAECSPIKGCELFLNTHPTEIITEQLIQSLEELRGEYPNAKLTIEIHESSMTDPETMCQFRDVLRDLDMRLSYDDFGAGQGRLLELTEAPPDVLKFDIGLIRGIDIASSSRQDLVRTLVKLAQDVGAITLAEGVETEGEHLACIQLGFELAQGFFYSKPSPLD